MRAKLYQPSIVDGYRGRIPMRACRAFVWSIVVVFAAALLAAPVLSAIF